MNPVKVASALVLLVCSTATPGQNNTVEVSGPKNQRADFPRKIPAKPGTLGPELQSVVDLTAAVPPELGADALITLVQSGKIADTTIKLDLLTQAFERAESAKEPVKRRALPGSPVETRSGYRAHALGFNLDRLSLQSRVVDTVLTLNAQKARQLFEQIRFPTLEPLSCEEPLLYELTPFYQTLTNVLHHGFSRKEKLEGADTFLLRTHVSTLQSHAQVEPLAELLATADLSSQQLEEMVARFAASLQTLDGDERSFSTAQPDRMLRSFSDLIVKLNSKGLSSFSLLQALRGYLISNLRDAQCADAVPRQRTSQSLPVVARYFNEQFRVALQNAQLGLISEESLQGSHIGAAPKYYRYWQSSSSKQLLEDVKKLRFGTGHTAMELAERSTSAWHSELSAFLTELGSWNGDGEAEADVFNEKGVLYEGLLELVPQGDTERASVLNSFVQFIEQNSLESDSPSQWFMHVNDLRNRLARFPDTEKREIVKAFRNSRDPALNLYAQLDALERPQPDRSLR